jgi:hypothetical protein
MSIPGLSTIKNYILAGLAVAAGLLTAIASWYRGSLKSAQLKGSEEAREVERKDAKATQEGLQNEAKVLRDNDIDADHFS